MLPQLLQQPLRLSLLLPSYLFAPALVVVVALVAVLLYHFLLLVSAFYRLPVLLDLPRNATCKKGGFKNTGDWHQRLAICSSKCELFSKCDTPKLSQWNLPESQRKYLSDNSQKVAVRKLEILGFRKGGQRQLKQIRFREVLARKDEF